MRIEINELEILPPAPDAGPDAGARTLNPDRLPVADLGEDLRRWHREACVRESRLAAD